LLNLELGCYVSHARLPELGTGEVLHSEKGTIRIRFASGDRSFLWAKAEPYLEVTQAAPPPAPKAPKGAKAPKAVKPAKAAKPAAARKKA